MKMFFRSISGHTALLLLAVSCQGLVHPAPEGTLLISLEAPQGFSTRSEASLPDPGSFLITVTDASGNVVHESSYSRCPEGLGVPAGNYTVSARSGPFREPAFDSPLWGDTQVVHVSAGSSLTVRLACSQLNSGLRLEVDDSFRNAFPQGTLILQTAEGELPYGYDEIRTAYFLPGTVSLCLDDGGYVHKLLSRTLAAREILTLRIGTQVGRNAGGISIQVDTTRHWLAENFRFGDADAGQIENAYDAGSARDHPGERAVWVKGYIVGVATSSSKVDFEAPFTKATNLVLGPRANTSDPARCLSVELPAGPVRDGLNLVDHPELLGRQVYLKGDLVSAYYGIPGLKAPTEYQLQ